MPPFYSFPIKGNEKLATSMVSKPLFNGEFCDKLLQLLDDKLWEEGLVASNKEEKQEKVRSCLQQTCPYLEKEGFPYQWIMKAIINANQSFWNFELSGFNLLEDPPVIIRYHSQRADFYDWHMDYMRDKSQRKLSFVIQLSDEQDYEGGELLMFPNGSEKAPKKRGSFIVFPQLYAPCCHSGN